MHDKAHVTMDVVPSDLKMSNCSSRDASAIDQCRRQPAHSGLSPSERSDIKFLTKTTNFDFDFITF